MFLIFFIEGEFFSLDRARRPGPSSADSYCCFQRVYFCFFRQSLFYFYDACLLPVFFYFCYFSEVAVADEVEEGWADFYCFCTGFNFFVTTAMLPLN